MCSTLLITVPVTGKLFTSMVANVLVSSVAHLKDPIVELNSYNKMTAFLC